MLEKLKRIGIQFLDTFRVNNALARPADAHLIGSTFASRAEIGKSSCLALAIVRFSFPGDWLVQPSFLQQPLA